MTVLLAGLRNAEPSWLDCAWRAMRQLAAEGRDFTANDLTEMGVPDPDHSGRWGSLFAAAKAEGLIVPVGYQASRRRSRQGGVCRVWRGAYTTRAVLPCVCNHGRPLHTSRGCYGTRGRGLCECKKYEARP